MSDIKGKDYLLTESQVQERYGLKVGTLRAWRNRGPVKLPFVKIGSMVRYRIGDLDDFIADNLYYRIPGSDSEGEG